MRNTNPFQQSEPERYYELSGFVVKKKHFLTFMGMLYFLVVVFFLYKLISYLPVRVNSLALGTQSRVAGELKIPVYQPIPLSGLSRKGIAEARNSVVLRHSELYFPEYRPIDSVFGSIGNGLPWFSLKGYFYLGRGPQSTEGPSSLARYIVNPFLLVAPEFLGLSIWEQRGVSWAKDRIKPEDMNSPEFPLYCRTNSLTWWPQQARAEAVYWVKDFVSQLNKFSTRSLVAENIDFALIGYNAKDFGFNYLAIDPNQSANISNFDEALNPVLITSSLGAKDGACADGVTCNHIKDLNPAVDYIVFRSLPAHISVKLWKQQPSAATSPADMTFVIKMQ